MGGVLVRHRFGGALNLNVHAHVLLLDGGHQREGGEPRLVQTAGPDRGEMEALAATS